MRTTLEHERVTFRLMVSEGMWCLKGAAWNLVAPVRRLPLCRLGVHEWCACCSPVSCIRCGVSGHD